MRVRRGLVLATACAVVTALLPAAAAGAATNCDTKTPTALHFKRSAGKPPKGRLFWHRPKGVASGVRYRVFRNGKVIGQTVGRSASVSVKPGLVYEFGVAVVSRAKRVSDCVGRLVERVRFRMPTTPRRLAARKRSSTRVTLEWLRARPGDAPIVGYRIFRNGKVYKQVRRQRLRVPILPAQVTSFRVAAADTRGNLGHMSKSLRVRSHHRVPGRPGKLAVRGVTDTAIAIGWSRAKEGSVPLRGYRLYRDGKPVRQVQGRTATLSNLAPATTYKLTVAAVDKRGWLGGMARAISVTTAMPPPTDGRAHAFLLASTDSSFRDLQRHYQQVGTVYPTYYECRSGDGAILGVDDPLVTGWAKMRKVKVLPRFDCQRPSTLNRILNDDATRTAVIEGLAGLVQTYGYNGINIDFEAGYATDRDALTSFIRALGARLHPMGAQITLEVSPKNRPTTTGRSGFYDYPALAAVADHVFVMNWGYHWTTSAPGAPDDISLASKVADYVATMPFKSKWVLGTNLYGLDWPNGGGPDNVATAMEYSSIQALIARVGAQPAYDSSADSWHFEYNEGGVDHEVWFGNAATVGRRVQLAADRGLGIGLWRLGEEDEAVWSDGRLITNSLWPQ